MVHNIAAMSASIGSPKPRQPGDDLNDWCFKQYRDFMKDKDPDDPALGPEILGVGPLPRMATPLGGLKLASLRS